MSYDRELGELFESPDGVPAVSFDGTPVTGGAFEMCEHDRRQIPAGVLRTFALVGQRLDAMDSFDLAGVGASQVRIEDGGTVIFDGPVAR